MNDIASVLAQIRSLQGQVGVAAPGVEKAAPANVPGFAETLQNALGAVNKSQMESRKVAEAFELGDPRADLVKVMMAAQESQLAFRATVEVRNKLVQAYQDVMNMPL
jgi:flagellar hook-basal body complex protein FliE